MSSRALRYGKNVAWNILGQGCLLVVSFLLVPLLVRGLGDEGYALYGLLGLCAGYLCLLNIGASNATLKFVSEFVARKDAASLWAVIRTSLLFHIAGVSAGAAVLFLLRGPVVEAFLNVSPRMHASALWVLAFAAGAAVFVSLIHCAVGIFQGLQRFGLSNLLTSLQAAVVLAGSVLLLRLGWDVRAVAVLYLAVNALLACVFLIAAIRCIPLPLAAGGSCPPGTLRTFAGYAWWVFLAQIAWSVTFNWDKAFIGHFFPLADLTYYLIPAFILGKFWVIPSSVTIAAFPVISELAGLGEHEKLHRVYGQCSQLVLWLVVPSFSFLFVLAPQILTLWLGAEFSARGVWPLRLLLGGYFFHLLGAMPVTAAYGLGKPRIALAWQAVQAALCFTLWFVLIPRYSITGAALGFLIAQAAAAPLFVARITRRSFGMGLRAYLDDVLLRPLASAGAFLILLWFLRDYAWDWFTIGALVGVSTVLYFGAGYALLGGENREALSRLWGSAG